MNGLFGGGVFGGNGGNPNARLDGGWGGSAEEARSTANFVHNIEMQRAQKSFSQRESALEAEISRLEAALQFANNEIDKANNEIRKADSKIVTANRYISMLNARVTEDDLEKQKLSKIIKLRDALVLSKDSEINLLKKQLNEAKDTIRLYEINGYSMALE